MRPALLFAAFALLAGAGCGAEIGDSCIVSTDCAQDGTRFCDLNSDSGYCTIAGCDYGTCPAEAECVRFFTGAFSNKTCTAATEDCVVRTCPLDNNGVPIASDTCSVGTCPHTDRYTQETPPTDDCNDEELCQLDGHCVSRSSEVRYCMRKCSTSSDCRDKYECRDETLMKKDGGEPVPPPGEPLGDNPQPFCAQSPPVPPTT